MLQGGYFETRVETFKFFSSTTAHDSCKVHRPILQVATVYVQKPMILSHTILKVSSHHLGGCAPTSVLPSTSAPLPENLPTPLPIVSNLLRKNPQSTCP